MFAGVCECVFFMFRVLGAALQAPVTSWVMLMVVGGNVIAVSLDTFHTIDPPLGHVCLPGCSLTGIKKSIIEAYTHSRPGTECMISYII